MIESNNPGIDVDALVKRVRAEVGQLGDLGSGAVRPASYAQGTAREQADLEAVHLALAHAERRAQVRTQWPHALHFFPFTFGPLRRLLLRAFALAFRDQSEVNLNLLKAARTLADANQRLAERIAALEDSAKP